MILPTEEQRLHRSRAFAGALAALAKLLNEDMQPTCYDVGVSAAALLQMGASGELMVRLDCVHPSGAHSTRRITFPGPEVEAAGIDEADAPAFFEERLEGLPGHVFGGFRE